MCCHRHKLLWHQYNIEDESCPSFSLLPSFLTMSKLWINPLSPWNNNGGLAGVDANLPPVVAGRLKANSTLNKGEKGMVPANTDITAGVDAGTLLAN